MGWLAAIILTEEIARASSSLRVQINMLTLGCAFTIYRYGLDDDVKKKYIPKLVSAEYMGGFGITEPNAGSDVMAMKSTAQDKGDHWLLNGSKNLDIQYQRGRCPHILCLYGQGSQGQRTFRLRD